MGLTILTISESLHSPQWTSGHRTTFGPSGCARAFGLTLPIFLSFQVCNPVEAGLVTDLVVFGDLFDPR